MKNKKTFLKKQLGILISAMMMISSSSMVLADEADYSGNIPGESITVNDEETVEEIDPNIIVTVTELEEAPIMPYSYYSSYFDFNGDLVGRYRYFDGNHIGAELTTSSDLSGKNFTLKLVRSGKVVAKANLPQNGSFHVDFTNIYNPNNYRFEFDQDFLGSCHQWGTINMFSWE